MYLVIYWIVDGKRGYTQDFIGIYGTLDEAKAMARRSEENDRAPIMGSVFEIALGQSFDVDWLFDTVPVFVIGEEDAIRDCRWIMTEHEFYQPDPGRQWENDNEIFNLQMIEEYERATNQF